MGDDGFDYVTVSLRVSQKHKARSAKGGVV